MTDATGALVWDVIFRPFGEVNNISENPATTDQRFPGKVFEDHARRARRAVGSSSRTASPATGIATTTPASGAM